MSFRPEMIEELQSRNVSVRADVLRQINRTNFTREEEALIFPAAAEQFAKEAAKTRRKMLAALCVRSAEAARDVPGLAECLTLTFRGSKDSQRQVQRLWEAAKRVGKGLGHHSGNPSFTPRSLDSVGESGAQNTGPGRPQRD